jgi:histone H4
MAGRGKVGKQAGKEGAKRNVKLHHAKSTVTIGAIRRLARRGGVKRISSTAYAGVRDYIDEFL